MLLQQGKEEVGDKNEVTAFRGVEKAAYVEGRNDDAGDSDDTLSQLPMVSSSLGRRTFEGWCSQASNQGLIF